MVLYNLVHLNEKRAEASKIPKVFTSPQLNSKIAYRPRIFSNPKLPYEIRHASLVVPGLFRVNEKEFKLQFKVFNFSEKDIIIKQNKFYM